MDVTQPLVRGTFVKYNGLVRWIQFRYEKCPDFCYNCGIIGHGKKSCFNRRRMEDSSVGQQFGDWLKAKSSKPVINSGKSQTNQDSFKQLNAKSKRSTTEKGIQILEEAGNENDRADMTTSSILEKKGRLDRGVEERGECSNLRENITRGLYENVVSRHP